MMRSKIFPYCEGGIKTVGIRVWSRRISAIKCFVAVLIVSLAVPAAANNCHRLKFELATSLRTDYYLSSATCTVGTIDWVDNYSVGADQKGVHGVTCNIVVHSHVSGAKGRYASLTVHQNSCVLKSGDIRVTVGQKTSNANPVYTIKEGSFSDKREGLVTVTGM